MFLLPGGQTGEVLELSKTQCYFGYWRKLGKNVLLLFHSSVHVRFLVDKTVLGQFFLQVILFCPVNIIPLMLHTHLHLNTILNLTDNGEKPEENPNNAVFFPTSGNVGQKVFFSHNFIGFSSSPWNQTPWIWWLASHLSFSSLNLSPVTCSKVPLTRSPLST